MDRRWIAIAVVVACHKPPPARAPTPELAVTGLASVAGTWVTADDLDWSYRLTIEAGGRYVLHVDRNKLGACDEKAELTTTPGKPTIYALVFAENQCRRDLSNTAARLEITSFTGSTLAIAVIGDGVDERHRFDRAPVNE